MESRKTLSTQEDGIPFLHTPSAAVDLCKSCRDVSTQFESIATTGVMIYGGCVTN